MRYLLCLPTFIFNLSQIQKMLFLSYQLKPTNFRWKFIIHEPKLNIELKQFEHKLISSIYKYLTSFDILVFYSWLQTKFERTSEKLQIHTFLAHNAVRSSRSMTSKNTLNAQVEVLSLISHAKIFAAICGFIFINARKLMSFPKKKMNINSSSFY